MDANSKKTIYDIGPGTAFDEAKPYQKFRAGYNIEIQTLVIQTTGSVGGPYYTARFEIPLQQVIENGVKSRARALAGNEGDK